MADVLMDKRVLVVDDQATQRMLVSASLEHSGVTVLEAADATSACEIARSERCDAFVLDINMPRTSGIELCRALREMPQYRHTPVVFVTGMAPSELLQWALDAGGDDFIRKPVQSVVLRARLRSLLERAAHLSKLERLSRSLHGYVSPRTEKMAREQAATGVLPPARREEVCVLFSDARGLTSAHDELTPEEVVGILSRYLGAQVDLVRLHGGYVDKFLGDGLLAIFDGPERVRRCCLCALDLLDLMRGRTEELGIEKLGIGVHAGPAVIGNLGSPERLDYSFVGRTVSLAARLSGLSAGNSIVVSGAVRDALAGETRLLFGNERLATVRGAGELAVFDLSRRRTPRAQ